MISKILKLVALTMLLTSLSACSAWDTLRGHSDDSDTKVDEKKLERDINKQLTEKNREELNKMVEGQTKQKEVVVTPIYN